MLVATNSIHIWGNYTNETGARLSVTLGTNTNVLTVSGKAQLSGELDVNLGPDFTPVAGQVYTILSAQSLQGKFTTIQAPTNLPGGLRFGVVEQGSNVLALVMDSTTDSDHNGLPDWWEVRYLGAVTSRHYWADSILKDGIPDGVKYALNINPTVPVDSTLLTQAGTSNGYPTLTYRQMKGGSGTIGLDYTAQGYTFFVQIKCEINSPWTGGSAILEWTGRRTDNGDGTETVTVRALIPVNNARPVFLRLAISR